MFRLISLIALLALGSASALAQDTRYISDTQYIPVRSGAGNDYRIVHRGLPSGTRLTVLETSADGDWARISTGNGTEGWLRAQYLMAEAPAATQLEQVRASGEQLRQRNSELEAELANVQTERSELSTEMSDTGAELAQVTEELAQLKQISGKAVQLDTDNRRLTEEAESLRAEVGTLEAENQRLQDKLQSGQFIDGALAVLLGVIITLVVPRLWPKRRRSSSWA
ncbi:TIGR04211 family SH3 domain-containing protein [Parahaliea mediterranea]|uniref:TIGR04211 family SH3 domain-containing protein n=1 Tax=Parahaliea mediterranea TaxID=651086 RepID=UPI001F4E49D6|nr:TIGR04211 family SH3 domain-containing protein [Parahaliea mediterranea]